MPQGLIKTPGDAGQVLQAAGRPLVAAHEQIVGVLRNRLGQNHGELLAIPRVEADGGIAWSTGLAGAVLPAAQLPEDERRKLQQRAERMLAEIRGLAQQLRGEGPASQALAQMLGHAAQQPPGDWLYSVGGRPVLVMWGHAAPGAMATETATPIATAAPATPRPVTPPPAGPDRPWKRWLLWGLLALLLLALLGWGLKRCSEQPVADAGLDEQLAQAEARNQALEGELARKRGQTPQLQCVPDAPPPAASAPEPAASAPPPNPTDDLEKRIAEAGKDCKALQELLKSAAGPAAETQRRRVAQAMAAQCRENLIREAKNLCPGERPKAFIPEFVIVFDTSPSMAYSLNASKAELDRAEEQQEAAEAMRAMGMLRGPTPLERLMVEPQRVTPAREAAVAVTGAIPPDMGIGLVMVDSCAQGARPIGVFPPAQRSALLARLRALRAAPFSKTSGTPLADGLAKAGRMIDGVDREATILLISDGEESCKGDPCGTAAALARAKPRLKINVVDITGTGAGNCVAAATRGQVFTARNAAEVAAMTRRAAQQAMGPADCRR